MRLGEELDLGLLLDVLHDAVGVVDDQTED